MRQQFDSGWHHLRTVITRKSLGRASPNGRISMKNMLFALLFLPAQAFAQSLVVGSTSAQAGATAPGAVPISLTNGTGTATAVRDIDARLTFDPEILTMGAVGNGQGSCTVLQPGHILVSVPDNGEPIPDGIVCYLTGITISANATAGFIPLTIANGPGSGCTAASGGEIACGYASGTVTVGSGQPDAIFASSFE